jgi:putative ABC transport system permease protein
VINEASRQRFFGAATGVGLSLVVDDQRFEVVGVVRDVPILRLVPFADVWVPYTTAKTDAYRKELVGDFMGIAVARSASDFKEIQDEYRSRVARVQPPDPKMFTSLNARAETFFDFVSSTLFSGTHDPNVHPERLAIALAVLTTLFVLLPAVNLVNLNVSRILERASEIGVRRAFGASSRTLVVQFMVENLVLTLVGAAVGLVVAAIVLAAINRSGLILYEHLTLNLRIFGWGVLLALVFGLLSGVYPAWRMSRLKPVQALKGGTR